MPKSLADLAGVLEIPLQPSWSAISVTGICEDTRRLNPGDLFVAIPGHHRDGTEFIDVAIERGAAAVVAERSLSAPIPVLSVSSARMALALLSATLYDHPTSELFTVGVTGTNGKTTVCHWIADVLGRGDTRVVSTVSSRDLGFPGLTTPPNSIIQSLARDAVAANVKNLVIEASSAGIEQERTSSIDFDICVFTNLSIEHVRHHQGLDGYRRAKMKLFENLKPEAWAVINGDDPMAEALIAATPAHTMTYGFGGDVDVRASNVVLANRSSQFMAHLPGRRAVAVRLSMPGSHNISNALAALGVGTIAGVPLETMGVRLSQASPIPGRSAFFRRSDGLRAVVDFAHNGASLEALLSTLRGSFNRLIVVFGCPGDGETEKRVAMGKAAARWADCLIVTSDNPKHESPRDIVRDILVGVGESAVSTHSIVDRKEAIDRAIAQATPGDLVILAGKGHENDQLVGNKRIPHSDSNVLRERGFVADDELSES